VLAKSVVLVEGPSDEILFERAFADKRDGATPIDKGIDVVSMRGVALKRTIQLCAALDRRVAALRDNDGKTAEHWTSQLSEYLETGKREVFIGDPGLGHTLEPQLGHANEIETLRTVLELDIGDDVVEWMTEHKTEAALRLAEAAPAINYPRYMLDAIEFIG
jgi:putative ATP-dependent endonuclease of OLD family